MSAAPVGYHLMLRVRGPKGLDRIEDLIRDEYVLGRGDPARSMDFAIPEDEYLSRVHLRLIRAGETYAVENLSENGTRLNGKALTKPTPLKHKDRIEAGAETTLEFLAMTDQERAEALKGAGPASEKQAEKVKKSKQPLFLAMIAFYAFIGLVVMMAVGQGEPAGIPDPGDEAFLAWMKRMPLQGRDSEAEWNRAEQHGGRRGRRARRSRAPPCARASPRGRRRTRTCAAAACSPRTTAWPSPTGSGRRRRPATGPPRTGGPPTTIQGAIEAMAVRGRDTLQAAAQAGDPPAIMAIGAPPKKPEDPPDANAAMTRLEKRLSSLKIDARRYANSGLRRLERERLLQILDAVPDVYQPIRQWAEWRLSPGAGTR